MPDEYGKRIDDIVRPELKMFRSIPIIPILFLPPLPPNHQKNPPSSKNSLKNFAVSKIIPTFAKNNREIDEI
jgi:hypothetical protein